MLYDEYTRLFNELIAFKNKIAMLDPTEHNRPHRIVEEKRLTESIDDIVTRFSCTANTRRVKAIDEWYNNNDQQS